MADTIEGRKPVFSGWPMVIGWLAMLIFTVHACTHMVAAGDTWVALACGRHFWNHGVNTVEPFSANSHKAGPTIEEIKTWPGWAQKLTDKVGLKTVRYWHPTGWVNQNWLTHEIFYWLTTKSPFADAATNSFNTLVYWKFTIYILAVICVYFTARLLQVNPALATVFACFAMFTGRSFIDIRPAGFSNVLVAVLMLIFVLATYKNILYIWLIVPLAVFWCNVHGGYIYLFIMLIPFIFLNLLTTASKKWFVSIGLRGLIHTIAAGFASFVAMVIFNPFHLTNLTHTFLISISKHAEMWRNINEWHPAFEWDNPVGTGFSFFVLVVLGSSVFILWLFSRLLKPRHLAAPKNILDTQKRMFNVTSKIFGYSAAIFAGWTVLIALSMLSLDFGSFLIAAVFGIILLLSIYRNFNFIYLMIPLILAGMWTSDSAASYQGRYIYPFILVPAYVLTFAIAWGLSKDIKIKSSNIILVTLTAIVTLLSMTAIFNPFKFNEPVWKILQFLDLQRIWYPRYELASALKLDYTHLFPVLYLLNLTSVAIWLILPRLRDDTQSEQTVPKPKNAQPEPYQLPKIDLALIAIAALTIYMALRSRRFIPIAAVAACPVIAMFVDQIIRTVAAALNFHRKNSFAVPPIPAMLRSFCILTGAAAVIFFGIMWGLRFKKVYLDPWPKNDKLNSIFIRMTNSDAKPFYACEFMRDNKLSGKMFNYWTEGGFIAWGQNPDPNTGKTPLQLFMDGRAQAAYEPAIFVLWQNIMGGGPYFASAIARGEKPDYQKVGQWIGGQLKKYNVWVVLMPAEQLDSPFMKGMEHDPNWAPIFISDEQKMLIDMRTPRGKELFDGVFDGRTIYRDDFYRNILIADILLRNEKTAEQGLNFAIKAFKSKPCRTSALAVISAIRFSSPRDKAYETCRKYYDEFEKNKALYATQDGYYDKLITALYIVTYLRESAQIQHNTEMSHLYQEKRAEYGDEIDNIFSKIVW